MDKDFVIKHFLYMLPAIIIVLVFLLSAVWYPADWTFHIGGRTLGGYPPLAPALTNLFYVYGMFVVFCVALFVVIPYVLLHLISKKDIVGLAYLYLSGLPYTLLWGGFAAQGIIHILILLCALNPLGWLLMLVVGPFTHRLWFFALLLGILSWILLNRARVFGFLIEGDGKSIAYKITAWFMGVKDGV